MAAMACKTEISFAFCSVRKWNFSFQLGIMTFVHSLYYKAMSTDLNFKASAKQNLFQCQFKETRGTYLPNGFLYSHQWQGKQTDMQLIRLAWNLAVQFFLVTINYLLTPSPHVDQQSNFLLSCFILIQDNREPR